MTDDGGQRQASDPDLRWYPRSLGDHDTHRGVLRDGVVHTSCGITYPPQWLACRAYALPGYPQDRDQICPRCLRARGQLPQDPS